MSNESTTCPEFTFGCTQRTHYHPRCVVLFLVRALQVPASVPVYNTAHTLLRVWPAIDKRLRCFFGTMAHVAGDGIRDQALSHRLTNPGSRTVSKTLPTHPVSQEMLGHSYKNTTVGVSDTPFAPQQGGQKPYQTK